MSEIARCMSQQDARWQEDICRCSDRDPSPILIDVAVDGFSLTDAAGGVRFDLDGDGRPESLSWTSPGADDAWLALDGDGDGRMTSGRELFGNFTEHAAGRGAQRLPRARAVRQGRAGRQRRRPH